MKTRNPIADELSELLDMDDLPGRDGAILATGVSATAVADAALALRLRHALKYVQPEEEFVTQLETRMLSGALQDEPGSAPASIGWLRRVIVIRKLGAAQALRAQNRLALVVSGALALLVLALAAAFLLPLLNPDRQASSTPAVPMLDGQVPDVTPSSLSTYVLSGTTVLPAVPERLPLLQAQPPVWSPEQVQDLALRIGLAGLLSVTLDSASAYVVRDGMRFISARGSLLTYLDTSVYTGDGSPLSFTQTTQLARDFLKTRGLLDYPYRVEPDPSGNPGVVRFVRLVDGRPVGGTDRAYEARVEIAADGRIASVYSLLRTLALSREVNILSAAEAWDALQQGQAMRVQVGGTFTSQALATSSAPPADANSRVNGIVGRLSATLYQNADGSLARIDARLSEWRSEPASSLSSSWYVTLTGSSLRAVTAYDGLRVRVWGHYDAASRSVDVEQYEQADPSEHVRVFLGVITNTVVDGTMRSIFTVSAPVQAGERFILAGSLRCTKEQELCPAGAPTDRPVIVEGALGRDTFNGIPILYDLSSGDATGLTENELRRWPRRPLVLTVQDDEPARLIEVPNPTMAPQPTALASAVSMRNTPPYQPGQRVEGAEGYLYAYITQDENGQTTSIKAGLSVLPLAGNRWGAALSGPALETMAQYDGTRVRVWGTFGRNEHDQPLIEVERFEKVDPAEQVQAWLGRLVTTTIEGRTVLLLQTRQGERFVLASRLLSSNGDEPYTTESGWGKQVVQEGVLRPETFGGYRVIQDWTRFAGNTIEQMTDLTGYQMQPRPFVSKPERLSPALVAHVEQIELIYNADATATTSPSAALLRPVWRFAGHLTDGRLFEAWVDAVRTTPARITLDTPVSQSQTQWTLSVSETVVLKAMLGALSEVQAPGTNWPGDHPEYRGMLLELSDEAGATQRLRVFNGMVAGTSMFRADPQRQLEHWLLRSGIGWIDDDLYAQLSQAFDVALPQMWTDVIGVSELSADVPVLYRVGLTTFFLIMEAGQPVALSTTDPHPRGCTITWDAALQRLVEPCLGSYYSSHGIRMGGPSPQDMSRFPTRLNGSRVIVDITRVIDGTYRAQRQPNGDWVVGATAVPTTTPAVGPRRSGN